MATRKFTPAQRREYLAMIDRIAVRWLDLFGGRSEFYSTVYWDLLARMWYAGEPVRKTDALRCITSIKSPYTAGKYVANALAQGLIEEVPNPGDRRSRLLRLSPSIREKLDGFFDEALSEVIKTSHVVAPKDRSGAA